MSSDIQVDLAALFTEVDILEREVAEYTRPRVTGTVLLFMTVGIVPNSNYHFSATSQWLRFIEDNRDIPKSYGFSLISADHSSF